MTLAKTVPSGDRVLHRAAIALYGWLYCLYCGLVLLDSVYARLLRAELPPVVRDEIFSEISDFLILPFGLLLLSGAAAVAAAKNRPGVMNLILISWLLPMLLMVLYFAFGEALAALGFGSAIRLVAAATGSILALAGALRFHQRVFRPG